MPLAAGRGGHGGRVKIVVGLGNPGPKYAETRHNVGWMVLDRLSDRAGISGRGKERDAAVTVRGRLHDVDIALVKPLTFMNDSGIAVRKILARERAPLDQMLVIVDDFALPFGRLRVRPDGTHGGHNGLRSIVAELETQRFARLRVGIGEPRRDAIDHVLSRFSSDERSQLPAFLDAAADAVETWARDGAPAAANLWNGWTLGGAADAAPPRDAAAGGRGGSEGGRTPSGQGFGRVGSGPGAAARGAGRATPAAGRGTAGDLPTPGDPATMTVDAAADVAAGPAASPADPEPGQIGGPAGADGIRRTRTGWRRVLPRGHEPDSRE
jgi:peptidyl-tRNA hydrolase, PTH1 family